MLLHTSLETNSCISLCTDPSHVIGELLPNPNVSSSHQSTEEATFEKLTSKSHECFMSQSECTALLDMKVTNEVSESSQSHSDIISKSQDDQLDKLRNPNPTVIITPDIININAGLMFTNELVTDRPCITARLFACFKLFIEQQTGNYSKGKCSPGNPVTLLLPLLQSLVTVEAISLRSFDQAGTTDATKELIDTKGDKVTTISRKRVQFSGIDCSSTLPPVDRVDGSDSHQRDSITALIEAKNIIDKIESDHEHASDTIISLGHLIEFLKFLLNGTYNLMDTCAESINSHPKRIEEACTIYLNDFICLRERVIRSNEMSKGLLGTSIDESGISQDGCDPDLYLTFENKLADFIGREIRFHLRMVLNPQPPRLSPSDQTYHLKTATFSKVSELVQLKMEVKGQRKEALDDACISALVSTALQHIYEFCGPDALSMKTVPIQMESGIVSHLVINVNPDVPNEFCCRPGSKIEIQQRSPFPYFDEDDLNDLQEDIKDASEFLGAAKAIRFILDLFGSNDVQQEITRLGGWFSIERCAKMSRKYKLWQICTNDAHLVPLFDHKTFMERLRELYKLFEKKIPACTLALSHLEEKLKGKNVLKRCPAIRVVHDALKDSHNSCDLFPRVYRKRQKK